MYFCITLLDQVANESDWQVMVDAQEGSSEPLLQLPPHSVRSVVLDYASNALSAAIQEAPSSSTSDVSRPLRWRCADLSRHVQAMCGDCVQTVDGGAAPRRGAVLLSGQAVDLCRSSPQLRPIIISIPGWVIACSLSSRKGVSGSGDTGSEGSLLVPTLRDQRRGDLFALTPGLFYDLTVSLRSTGGLPEEVEFALVLVRNEVPATAPPAAALSDATQPVSSLAKTPQLQEAETRMPYILTGKPYARYTLPGTEEGGSPDADPVLLHKVRLCLPQPCSVTVYPLLRSLSPTDREQWWCSEQSFFRLVAVDDNQQR